MLASTMDDTNRPIIGITLDSEAPGGYSRYPWYALRANYADATLAAGCRSRCRMPLIMPRRILGGSMR